MHHYTECGLRNVWLANGFRRERTSAGIAVAIEDVEVLHQVIGRRIARKPRLTGAELRYLRKEMDLSQRALGALVGADEQTVSLWERKGRIPKAPDRLLRLIYLEHLDGNVQIRKIIDGLSGDDDSDTGPLRLKHARRNWALAA